MELRKITEEQSLSFLEAHQLDEELSRTEPMGQIVRSLVDDEPSLAWRSSLNERLLALHKPRKSLWARPLALTGLGVACTIAATVFFMTRPDTPKGPPLTKSSVVPEQVLLDAHRTSAFATSTGAGDGSRPILVSTSSSDFQWSEADLGAF